MSTKPKVLVTSAAGRTGSAAVLQLLDMGFPTRAFVRARDARAEALERAGADLFVGDLYDTRDLRNAMVGVQRAYHCPPVTPNVLHGAIAFAVAAEEAKLEVVALMSQWNPHATHPSVITRGHWLANQVYRWMPSVDVVYVNPGMFAFMYLLGLPAIVHFGQLLGPFGDGLNAPPSNEDIARVATSVLADPAPHIGKNYRPTGPELISPYDIADILGRVVGHKVRYKDVSFKFFSKAAVAQGFALSDLAHVRYYAQDLRGGTFAVGGPTEHVREVTGLAPESFETIARRYVRNPSLIHPMLKVGGSMEAFALLLKTLVTPAPSFDAWERARGYPLLKDPVHSHDSAEWRATAERQELNLLAQTSAKPPALTAVG